MTLRGRERFSSTAAKLRQGNRNCRLSFQTAGAVLRFIGVSVRDRRLLAGRLPRLRDSLAPSTVVHGGQPLPAARRSIDP
jgi:hypothetical protein